MLACLPIFKCDHNPFSFPYLLFSFQNFVVTLDFPRSQKLIKTQVFIFFAWPIERFWKAANAWFSATPCSTLQSLLFFYSRGFFNPYTQALLGVPLAAAAQPNATAATAPAALNHHPLLGQLQVCLFPCSLTILPINVPFTFSGHSTRLELSWTWTPSPGSCHCIC